MSEAEHRILSKVRQLQGYVQRGMANPESVDVRRVFLELRDLFRDHLIPDLTSLHAANDSMETELGKLKEELATVKTKLESSRRGSNKHKERVEELAGELRALRG